MGRKEKSEEHRCGGQILRMWPKIPGRLFNQIRAQVLLWGAFAGWMQIAEQLTLKSGNYPRLLRWALCRHISSWRQKARVRDAARGEVGVTGTMRRTQPAASGGTLQASWPLLSAFGDPTQRDQLSCTVPGFPTCSNCAINGVVFSNKTCRNLLWQL